jgi:YYY domain-containing protein
MRNLADLSLSDFESAIPGLATLVPAVSGLVQVLNGDTLATYNYWDPTRVIPETINEFPFFSFLFADLHPHMIGIPFTILFLSLALNRMLPSGRTPPGELDPIEDTDDRHPAMRWASPLFRWLAIPFVLGAIGVINTWDLPTYLGIIVATYLLNRYRQSKEDFSLGQAVRFLLRGALFAGALLIATYLLYFPFFANYQAPAETGVGLVRTNTPLDQHLKIWGFFLFIIVSWLWLSLLHPDTRNSLLRTISLFLRHWNVWPHLSEVYRTVVKRQTEAYRLGLWSIGLLLLASFVLFLLGYRVSAYLFPLVVAALLLLFRRKIPVASAYLGLLTFTGLSIMSGVEFIFLRDFLGGGDYYRMNTLFKFYIQVWVMFGLVTAVMLPQIWEWAWRWSGPAQVVWRGAALVLLLAGLIYPVLGTRTRVEDRFPGRDNRPAIGTLDGLAYMTVGTFEWPAGNPIQLYRIAVGFGWSSPERATLRFPDQ